MSRGFLLCIVVSLSFHSSDGFADERLKGIACRSVHLGFPAEPGSGFYQEITVRESAPGTYFMVCGWNKGYFGIQELANGKKLILFSVWDSGQNNPDAVEKEKRTKLLHQGEGVRIGRFGGEGTGGQSFYDFDWKVGQTYRFFVTAKPNGQRTEYSGFFFEPERKTWKHLVTFSSITGGKPLGGYYSFVEDFRRNRVSTEKVRRAEFGNAWVKTTGGKWLPLNKARFTADRNPVMNINAGPVEGRFFLATGGKTTNQNIELWQFMNRPAELTPKLPSDLPQVPELTVDSAE